MTAPTSSAKAPPLSPADPSLLGRFIWCELLARDVAKATAFYPPVTGWTVMTMPTPGGGPAYTMFANGEAGVAGIQPYPPNVTESRAQWLPYIATDDADRTCREATAAGATVHKPPMDIPTIGRFAVLQDPQGAYFAIMRPFPPGMPERQPEEGEFAWHEMTSDDPEASFAFYQRLFRWEKLHAMDMGADGIYQMYGRGTFTYGGFMRRPQGAPPSSWTMYVRVPDLDKSTAATEAHGGAIMMGPHDVPNDDRIAIATDNQGAIFALVARKK